MTQTCRQPAEPKLAPEDELLLVMHEPPPPKTEDVGRWIAKMQSLLAPIRKGEKRQAKKGRQAERRGAK